MKRKKKGQPCIYIYIYIYSYACVLSCPVLFFYPQVLFLIHKQELDESKEPIEPNLFECI